MDQEPNPPTRLSLLRKSLLGIRPTTQIQLDLVLKIVHSTVESCSHRLRVELPNHATESCTA